MIRFLYLFILFFFYALTTFAQYNDLIWHQGRDNCTACFFRNQMNFKNGDAIVEQREGNLNVIGSTAAFFEKDSALFCYSNGIYIFNREHELMQNGADINPSHIQTFGVNGNVGTKNGFFLQHPDDGYMLYYFHLDIRIYPIGSPYYQHGYLGYQLLYTQIDMQANNGLGTVIAKNVLLLESPNLSILTANKHANGKDWWLLAADGFEDKYYRILFSEDGLGDIQTQYIGSSSLPMKKQTYHSKTFSFLGDKFVDFNTFYGVSIYDFDRCTGLLSNEIRIDFEEYSSPGTGWYNSFGCEFSRNSRFLYITNTFYNNFQANPYLIQYDLWADDVAMSGDTIARYDSIQPSAPFLLLPHLSHNFLTTGPDGRIYDDGNPGYLHYIKFPNRKGAACGYVPLGIFAETMNTGMPYLPNFRLGPIDGSSCDTLGIDNHPLATFRYDIEDTLQPFQVTFTDLSYYEPTSWSWDFGDIASGAANISSDTSPVHVFSGSGVYTVCLEVCNAYSCDTMCRDVVLGVSDAKEEVLQKKFDFSIHPNPANISVRLDIPSTAHPISLEVYDIQGKQYAQLNVIPSELSISDFPNGLYTVVLRLSDGSLLTSKFQKIDK